MTPTLLTYHDAALDGPTNMARDEHLLHGAGAPRAALRFYQWNPPTISLGYFQSFDAIAELPEEVRSLAVVRRLTGGGAILHDRELTYCIVLDESTEIARRAPAELYRAVHTAFREALVQGGPATRLAPEEWPLPSPRSGPFFCFERPGRTDLLIGDAKLLGSAQRRIPGRVLQHGSLLLEQRFAAHPGVALGAPDAPTLARWMADVAQRLGDALGLRPALAEWSAEQLADVDRRRARYVDPAWTRKR